MSNNSNTVELLRRCYRLAAPFGRGKMFAVTVVIFANGLAQVAGVTSVFPFFALAADPDRVANSEYGRWILSYLPPMDHPTLLIWAGVVSITALLVANGISITSEVLRMRYAHALGHSLRTQLMEAFCNRPYGYFLERNTGHLLQKITGDVQQFVATVCLPLLEAASRLVTIFFLLGTVFFVQPGAAAAAGAIFGAFYVIVFFALRRRSYALGQALKTANRDMMSGAQQLLGGIKPILVHGKADYFQKRFGRSSSAQARLLPRVPLYGNTPRYLVEPVVFGSLVGIVLWSAAHGRDLNAILPRLSVLALAAYRMLPSIQTFYTQFTQVVSMGYTAREVEIELEQAQEVFRSSAAGSPRAPRQHIDFAKTITLESISFSYPNAPRPVLDSFTLEIPKNSSVGIVGTTGSGKSTLVDIILGLHSPQKGRLLVDGREITIADLPAWRKLIGYVPQEIFLLDGSIEENIAFGIPVEEIDREAMMEAAGAAQIREFIETELPQKWKTEVGERGVRLSGGQRQRIGLARALYHKPQVLVLDEATSALDHETESEVMRAIEQLHGKITLIAVAHRLSTLNGCAFICRIGDGRGHLERNKVQNRE